MHQLVESLLRGRYESTLFYLYQWARDTTGQYEPLNAALAKVHGCDSDNLDVWVQRTDASGQFYQTALWDLAELYDFIGGSA
jgi:hypothetical protein